jgi:hypothetical protein
MYAKSCCAFIKLNLSDCAQLTGWWAHTGYLIFGRPILPAEDGSGAELLEETGLRPEEDRE